LGTGDKTAKEAGSELVRLICDHLSKVKQALLSRSNMDKVSKEEAMHAVSEMGSMLNRLSGIFMGLESTLKKVIIATEQDRARAYIRQLVTPPDTKVNGPKELWTVAQPSGDPPPTLGLIVKAADPKTSSYEAKRIIKEAVDPKALQLGVSKVKNLSKDALFVECTTELDRDTLEKELSKLSTINIGIPRKKIPTLLPMFVPKEVVEDDIKNTIFQ
jgi:hypothetical protein